MEERKCGWETVEVFRKNWLDALYLSGSKKVSLPFREDFLSPGNSSSVNADSVKGQGLRGIEAGVGVGLSP